MNNNFVNIDGNIIDKKTVKSVSKIEENYPMVIDFFTAPRGWFDFYVYCGNESVHYSESFRIGWFSNKPKSEFEKVEAFRKILEKKENILKLLEISE